MTGHEDKMLSLGFKEAVSCEPQNSESSSWKKDGSEMHVCLAVAYRSRDTSIPLRVQVPNNHILTQNLYYNYYYPNPKYLIIGYMDPLGT